MGPLTNPLFHFVDLLDKRGIRYALIGGVAVTLIARERFTKDVDFTVVASQEQADQLIAHLRCDPAYDLQMVQFVSSDKMPDMIRVVWGEIPIDLIFANIDFQREIVARAVSCEEKGKHLSVATPEDMIILKLLADRPRDREDIQSLLQTFTTLDWAYMEKWAAIWEIESRLTHLRASLTSSK